MRRRMTLPVILNPAARSTKAATLESRLRALSPAPEMHFTQCPGDAERLAFELASQGHRQVIAAGGDGTVNEAVHGLMRHNITVADPAQHVALGVLPAGTMNVFAHELGLPKNIEKCWRVVSQLRLREVDLWQANEKYFVQLAGVGLDAEIVRATSWQMKKRFGPLSYLISAARLIPQPSPVLTVHIDGKPPLHGAIVIVGNGRHYGGPVPVFRHAKNDDGLLDILIFHEARALAAMQFVGAMTIGNFERCGDLDYFQAREFRVECSQQSAFEIDGEFAGTAPVLFKPAPFRLKVAC